MCIVMGVTYRNDKWSQDPLVLGALSCVLRQREENTGWENLCEYKIRPKIWTVTVLVILK